MLLISGPVLALALRKTNAIKDWRTLCGPTNSLVAKKDDPNSLRALYGTDNTRNAVHGSVSVSSANRELGIIFHNNSLANSVPPVAKRLIIAGAPASGKGTQCEMIRGKYNVVHISTGDLLREAVDSGSKLGLEAKSFMDAGKLVPDEVIIGLVKNCLESKDCRERGWLLDGFPRTSAQASALKAAGIVVDNFILIDVPDEILLNRVLGRRSDPKTGKIYHLTLNPPPTEEIKARLVQRSDDTEDKIKVRIQTYHDNISSVIGQYQDKILKVNGNQDKNVVFQLIVNGIN